MVNPPLGRISTRILAVAGCVGAHFFTPSTQEAESERSLFKTNLVYHTKFQAIQGFIVRPYLPKIK